MLFCSLTLFIVNGENTGNNFYFLSTFCKLILFDYIFVFIGKTNVEYLLYLIKFLTRMEVHNLNVLLSSNCLLSSFFIREALV